jgi:hypothetical protein
MRAFKNISKQKENELLEVFPSAWNFEWQDDESFIQRPFSLWDAWLFDLSDDPGAELWNVSQDEKIRRENLFVDLAKIVIDEHVVYGLFFRQNKFKCVRSKSQLIKDITNRKELGRPLFIPALAAIFTQGHDYIGWLRLKDERLGAPLISLVEQVGLKFIV